MVQFGYVIHILWSCMATSQVNIYLEETTKIKKRL